MSNAGISWRQRLANLLRLAAAFFFVLALQIVVFGGIRVKIVKELSATHAVRPLLLGIGLTLLAHFLARVPWRAMPIVRLASRYRGWVAQPRSVRGAAVIAITVLACGFGLIEGVASWRRRAVAEKYEAEGRNDLAAQAYLDSIRLVDADRRIMHEKAAYAYWRADRCDRAIELLEPHFVDGAPLTKRGYRALWTCYRAKKRYDEAIEVTKIGMGTHVALENEAAGVLATLLRERTSDPTRVVQVELVVPGNLVPAEVPVVYLAGNWSASGEPSDVHGWLPQAVERTEAGFSLAVSLHSSTDFPYVAVAAPSPTFERPSFAIAQFRVNSAEQTRARIELTAQPQAGWLPATATRRSGADGRKRVVALWPDAGSWFLVGAYAHRGLMPNTMRLLRSGARGEMVSTNPPFTSTAYRRMVEMSVNAGDATDPTVLETIALQLKGIPFLDRLFPDSLAAGSRGPTIYSVLARDGLSAANLVFSDRFVSEPSDLTTSDGRKLQLDEKALYDAKEGHSIDNDSTAWLTKDVLHIDPTKEPARAAILDDVFLMGVDNTEQKARAGLSIWQGEKLDFMLLRFPSMDILSHASFWTVESSPAENAMVEAYRHLDDIIGRFTATLDQDDTLIFVSDHGIAGTLHHHQTCILVVEGPGIAPESTLPTVPIGHFPVVVLSRFGITDGSDRLNDDMYHVLFGQPRPAVAPAPSAPAAHGLAETLR